MIGARRKLVAGNWKMYKTLPDGLSLVTDLKRLLAMVRDVDVAVIPPALLVEPISRRVADTNIRVGVQNIHDSGFGAFTGELSADMLPHVGAAFCLAGHSERRKFFGETDGMVNRKVKAVLKCGVTPILCVGETLDEREAKRTFEVLRVQLSEGLRDVEAGDAAGMVIAYEPVWAIGTGRTATPEQVEEVHTWIRGFVAESHGRAASDGIRIQYGGSVKPSNAAELLHTRDVDGALVGGASLDAEGFAQIVKAGSKPGR